MKKMLICLILLVSFSACKDEHFQFTRAEVDESNPLIGKWQLVKYSYSTGTAEQHWQNVENGYILNLKKDSSFESNRYKTSNGGTYKIEGNDLILEYAGNLEPSQYTDQFATKGDTLSLSPISPFICIEGCTSKLVRIK